MVSRVTCRFKSNERKADSLVFEQPRRFCRRTHAERRRIYQTDPPSHSFRTGKMYSALKEQPAYKTYKPYANFLLVKLLQKETTAFDVFTHCVKNGLMIRDCSSFKSLDGEFIRFCVMDSKDNQRLLDELSFLCRQNNIK